MRRGLDYKALVSALPKIRSAVIMTDNFNLIITYVRRRFKVSPDYAAALVDIVLASMIEELNCDTDHGHIN
jgi:hypothetical protein